MTAGAGKGVQRESTVQLKGLYYARLEIDSQVGSRSWGRTGERRREGKTDRRKKDSVYKGPAANFSSRAAEEAIFKEDETGRNGPVGVILREWLVSMEKPCWKTCAQRRRYSGAEVAG